MFCDKCGATLQSDQQFCSRCGKEIAGPMLGYPQRSRVREHVRLLGILWIALSGLDGLMGVASYVVANVIFNPVTHPERPAFLHPFLSFIATIVIVKAFAGFVAGWGLLQREPWARTVAVVLAFPSLLFNVRSVPRSEFTPSGSYFQRNRMWSTKKKREPSAQPERDAQTHGVGASPSGNGRPFRQRQNFNDPRKSRWSFALSRPLR